MFGPGGMGNFNRKRESDMASLGGLVLYGAMFFLPAWFVLRLRRKWLGFALGTVTYWGLLLLSYDYLRAIDPEYDSIAPGFSLVLGWIPGLLYCLLCHVLGSAIRSRRQRRARSPVDERTGGQIDTPDQIAASE